MARPKVSCRAGLVARSPCPDGLPPLFLSAAQSPARANSTGIRLLSSVPHLWSSSFDCPASPGKEKTKCGWISPRTHSDGPVSQICLHRLLRRELLRAFATLDDSTPQRRISELRVWCLMNPLLCSRHHRQVTLAVKT